MARLLAVPVAALAAAGVCFLLLHFVPGGPFDTDHLSDPVLRRNLDAAYGLSRPWWAQWGAWSVSALRGDFGVSFHHRGISVAQLLAQAWPSSLALGTTALVLGFAVALPAAVAQAQAPRALPSRVALRLADVLLCLPTYVAAPVMLAGIACSPVPLLLDTPSGRFLQFSLAGATLALPVAAMVFRWTLVGLQETQAAHWWPAVRARSLEERRRWWRYALGAALPTLLGRLAPLAADVLTGALAVEAVFDFPGLGHLLGSAALHRDTPVLLGAVACSVVTVMSVQLVADWLTLAAGSNPASQAAKPLDRATP